MLLNYLTYVMMAFAMLSFVSIALDEGLLVNKHEQDVLLKIFRNKSISSKELAEKCGCPCD